MANQGAEILKNLIDRQLIKEHEAGDAFYNEAIDAVKGSEEDCYYAIRNLYEQDFIKNPQGDHMEEIGEYLEENKDKYEMAKGGKVSGANLLEKIKKEGKITEQEINLIKNRMNNGTLDAEGKELVQWIWDNQPELTSDQNKKGLDFLKNLWKSPTGKERTGNPFGYREEKALETFRHFTLDGFHDASRYGGRPFYIPLYGVSGEENGNFQYYYDGKVNIVGAKGGEMAKGGEVGSFMDYYASYGALMTGGSYFNTQKKGVGGLLIGLGLGAVGGYAYRNEIAKAKEEVKHRATSGIHKLAGGGTAYPQKRVPMTKRGKQIDGKVKALKAGWRVSKETGEPYFENRTNRSDSDRRKRI